MQPKTIEKYFFFGLLLATLIFAFFIFQPFWIILVLGASLSTVLYPIYLWIKKGYLSNSFASLLTVFFFIIVLCVPFFGVGSIVFNQSQDLYHSVVSNGDTLPFLNLIENKVNQILPNNVFFDMKEAISTFVSFLTGNIANIFNTTVTAILSFLLLLVAIFYFLKDGESWRKTFLKLSPLSDTDDEKILGKLSRTINGVIKGYLLVAFVQGTLMAIGLAIFHVPNWALWGTVAGIASILPPFGTALVSVPAVLFLFSTGQIGPTIGLLLWSILIVGTGDNFLTPYVVGHKINIPPFLILFSVLGGISLLGPVGVLIGPLTVSLLYALVEIYRNEFQ